MSVLISLSNLPQRTDWIAVDLLSTAVRLDRKRLNVRKWFKNGSMPRQRE
jgi:hypothetical protein